MLQIPFLPSWDSLHPLVIHFPIVLLLISPLFLIAGAILRPTTGGPYRLISLLLLLFGTGSLFLAMASGEAAGELAERGGAVNAVLEHHEALAEKTRVIFSGLTVILAAILFLPRLLRRAETRIFSTALPLCFLLLYAVGLLFLVNTAHAGGRLVHEFGVHAMISSAPAPQTVLEEQAKPGENRDNDKD